MKKLRTCFNKNFRVLFIKEYMKIRESVFVALVSTQLNGETVQKLKQLFFRVEIDVYLTVDFDFSVDAL